MDFNFNPAKLGKQDIIKLFNGKKSVTMTFDSNLIECNDKKYCYVTTFSSILENNTISDCTTTVSEEKYTKIILKMQMGRDYETTTDLYIENKDGVTYADINLAMKKHLEMNVKELSLRDFDNLTKGNSEWTYPVENDKIMLEQYISFLFVEGFSFVKFFNEIPVIELIVGS